ncbi:DHH family phosphoesterase [Pyrodictium abyssi]|uniref:DDH domain-containing protein n=1 Tax=Pyrodictium abyssi TaxID=54256 RepID=A0ABN6ZKV9_9CREN|nr:hypothetical protein PABY_04430 [Pyrodictium abyssi]
MVADNTGVPGALVEDLWRLLSSGRIFIVSHWDADGIASAALLLRALRARVAGVYPPSIGVYSLEALPWRRISGSGADVLAVLDYGLPGSEYDNLAEIASPRSVTVIDHHLAEPPRGRSNLVYVNPVALGLGGEEDWPSTTFIAYRIPGVREACRRRGCSWIAAVGIVGDLGPALEHRPRAHSAALRLVEESGYSLRDVTRAVELLDSCYRLLDEDCVVHAVELLGWATRPGDVLEDRRLQRAAEEAAKALKTAMERVRFLFQRPGIMVYYVESNAYVTSYVGRRLAARHPESVVVLLHWAPDRGRGFVYARSMKHRLAPVLQELRRRGIPAGGKDYVLAFPVDKRDDKILRELATLIERLVFGRIVTG